MKMNNLLIVISNLILLIYIVIIGAFGYINNWNANLLGNNTHLFVLLIIMFVFELLSTITFQIRIWLTSKDRIIWAAIIGSISWMIAGFQGLLLINGSINGLNDAATFFIKMPPVLIATFIGILTNYYISKRKEVNND